MRTIIAGSRDICDKRPLWYAVCDIKWEITQVVSGQARGIDLMGETYAKWANIPIESFPADWDRHGKSAGYLRNKEMAENAEALILVWDGKSRGSGHMKRLAEEYGLQGYEVIVNGSAESSGYQVRVLHSTDRWTCICFDRS